MIRSKGRSPLRYGLLAGLAVVGWTQWDGKRLMNQTLASYRSAVSDARKGEVGKASAVLHGLLMTKKVKLGVDMNTVIPGEETRIANGVRAGVETWNRELSDSPFAVAKPGEKADLVVRFVDSLPEGGDVQGAIDARRRFVWGDGGSRYEITGGVAIKRQAFGARLSSDQIGRVLAHELGHLLGLDDDYDGDGVMASFRLGEGHVSPSPEEISAVTEFRNEVRDALRLAS